MTMRRLCRALPLALVTTCVFGIFLHLQMRTKDSPKLPSEGMQGRNKPLRLQDIFIAVKTTGRFHGSRLALLLDTWISKTKGHTYIFTDTVDEDISSRGFNIIVTACSPEHSHQALSCKMAAEYDHFMDSDKEWLCHVDDDNYLNPKPLLDILSTFTPDTDVYIGKPSLDRPMRAVELLQGNKTTADERGGEIDCSDQSALLISSGDCLGLAAFSRDAVTIQDGEIQRKNTKHHRSDFYTAEVMGPRRRHDYDTKAAVLSLLAFGSSYFVFRCPYGKAYMEIYI
ncbi:hypothetical protein SRHO_G00310670 [Serrasalmus rhombeus]